MEPRRFQLVRRVDPSGVSGTGVVAYGVTFGDGHVVLRWHSPHPATSLWNSLDDLLRVHGHNGSTFVVWIDEPHPARHRGRSLYPQGTDPSSQPKGRHMANDPSGDPPP